MRSTSMIRSKCDSGMLWSAVSLVVVTMAITSPCQVQAKVLELHGSGTTNPSKCFWLIMDQFMDRLRATSRLTYRAVGSGTGQEEFMGLEASNYSFPINDFGSGDIPISSENYQKLQNNSIQILHFPFVLGAISLFHSIPGVKSGEEEGLKLSPCLLARIFKRDITIWDHQDILNINPDLQDRLPRKNFEITIAHRQSGSSSTKSFTQYLHESCSEEWPEDMVGKTIDWPADSLTCEGSAGMTNCIRDNEGTIGYIDSGHGLSENLVEIELQNKDGHYLSSQESASQGGIGFAAASIPDSLDKDFGSVDLLNQGGRYTWPIVAMSYVYVRKDLSHINSPAEQELLKSFLKSLYESEYIEQCEDLFGFTRAPDDIKILALSSLNTMLEIAEGAPKFFIENSIQPNVGQEEYAISVKRRTYAEYSRGTIGDDLTALKQYKTEINDLLLQLKLDMERLDNTMDTIKDTTKDLALEFTEIQKASEAEEVLSADQIEEEISSVFDEARKTFTSKHDRQLTAAVTMASLSIVCWAAFVLYLVKRRMGLCAKDSSPEVIRL